MINQPLPVNLGSYKSDDLTSNKYACKDLPELVNREET